MDLQQVTSIFDILRNPRQFQIETVPAENHEMLNDLQERIAAYGQAPWSFALLVGKGITDTGQLTGLVLLEEIADDTYTGLYYPYANCGGGDEASRFTFKMILALAEWPDHEALERALNSFGTKFQISQLQEDDISRLGHFGPTIEPI